MPSPPPRSRRTVAGIRPVVFIGAIIVLAWIGVSSAGAARLSALLRMVDREQAAHPNALWHIVNDLCVPDMKVSGNPAPCAQVNLTGGYAVVKDVARKTQYLLIPTQRVSGIESPELLTPASPNYWQAAWTARRLIERQLGRPLPRADIGLAINALVGRTQNQLHIHIDCVRPGVQHALQIHEAQIGPHWSDLDFTLAGGRYRARWISGEDLGANDPFKLLADGDPIARVDMADETLVLIAASRLDGAPGFVLLSDRADPSRGDIGAGEGLLDHSCRVLS